MDAIGIGGFPSTTGNISMFMVRDNAGAKTNDVEYFNNLMGVGSTETTDIDRHYFVMPLSGDLKNFRVKYDATLTGAMAIEYYLVINGSDTLLATVDSSGSTKYNTNRFPVVAGDLVAYKVIVRNTPTNTHYWLNIEFEHPTHMAIVGNCKGLLNTNTARYFMPQNSVNALFGTTSDAKIYYPAAGTTVQMYVRLSQAPGVGSSRTIRVYRESFGNDGSVVISDNNTTGIITLNRAKIQGNQNQIEMVGTGTPADCYVCYGMSWLPAVKGEYPIFMEEYATPSNTVRNWDYVHGVKVQWTQVGTPFTTGTEQRRVPLRGGYTIKKLYAKLETAPGSGKSWEFGYMTNDTTSCGLLATVSDTNTTGFDNTNSYTTIEGEEYALTMMPVGTPTLPSRTFTSFILST